MLELPLAINPSGAARTEPRLRNQLHWKRAHTQRTGSSARPAFVSTAIGSGEVACPYSKQFVHSKSSQYKKMKQEWRNNVYLARYSTLPPPRFPLFHRIYPINLILFSGLKFKD